MITAPVALVLERRSANAAIYSGFEKLIWDARMHESAYGRKICRAGNKSAAIPI
jgi:hypothetical protein